MPKRVSDLDLGRFKADLLAAGFVRHEHHSERAYVVGNVRYPTYEKDGARFAFGAWDRFEEKYGGAYVYLASPGHVTLRYLYTEPSCRRAGRASAVLEQIVTLADRYGFTLYLEPVALEEKNKRKQEAARLRLVAFYQRFGFVGTGPLARVMRREPARSAQTCGLQERSL